MTDYELLTVDNVPAYLASRPALAAFADPVSVREIGDGNMNIVFAVATADGPGVVLKQSMPYVRVDPTWPITPDRNRIEAVVLAEHGRVAPGLVPALLDFDDERHVVALEDLSDHRVWRGLLNEGVRTDGVAADLGRYVAKVAFGTSVFGLGNYRHKDALAASINPELCEITEDLVFTEPYIEHEHNKILPATKSDVAAYVGDPAVRTAIGLAKLAFMTHGEALIHGDLHTGSVLVRPGSPVSARAFDVEFAFYGPVGFDLGALWGNYVLAAARSFVLGDTGHATWALGLAEETWTAFETEFTALWPDRVDPRIYGDGVLAAYLAKVRADSAVFAAAKATRRIIGFARVSDIETLPEPERATAIRGVLRVARHLLTTEPGRDVFDRVGDLLVSA
ncbi:S-methyl-5-thioribose kinase [Herbidospora mongoliensis]|uniref:S-methyl-5-thioribose kinase n=1 Tax=Herbidospora mongoliensis TaxID=688067 RepID=UPI00082A4E64|nr:S-methyl-5-thioribose kinase [Herbidospora mongoliensis]